MKESIVDRAVQVNDGLNEAAACSSTVVYDKKYGLVFLVYMSGTRLSYGESTGHISLSVFSPTQPTNVRFRRIDEGVGGSRGVLVNCAYLIGDAKIRILFTTTRGTHGAYYRDYDFLTDTLSERTEVFFLMEGRELPVTNETYRAYLGKFGYTDVSDADCIVNKASVYHGEIYTALTVDGVYYPILCKIGENCLIPFAVCPVKGTYEFRYYRAEEGIHAVYRYPVDDPGIKKTGYAFSPDNGKTWESRLFEDGVQSRPDILPYDGKPLIVYNYKSEKSSGHYPPMHNHRNAVKMLYEDRVIFDCFEKYGIVEHTTVNIAGDLYMAFSTSEQALSTANGKAWIEEGRPVEQGKEEIKWVKLGEPAD